MATITYDGPGTAGLAFEKVLLPINKNLWPADTTFATNPTFGTQLDYEWIYIATIIFSFITAMGIGANDVANAFATSVGAKALTVWQAVIIAAIFEFLGAFLLGSRVTDTVRKYVSFLENDSRIPPAPSNSPQKHQNPATHRKITSNKAFIGNDDLLMFGFFGAEVTVGIWLFAATAMELPVSTTHSMIGAIIGFSMCSPAGPAAVNWESVGMIVLSWFASPALSGIFAAAIYFGSRSVILRHENSFERGLKFYPILVGFTIALNAFFIMFKGGISKGSGFFAGTKLDIGTGIGIAIGIGAGVGIICVFTLVPWLRSKLVDLPDVPEQLKTAEETDAEAADAIEDKKKDVHPTTEHKSFMQTMTSQTHVHEAIHNDARVSSMHASAEAFPIRTERLFAYLQVFTAIFDSFSHGANDVANSIGPLAAVVAIYTTGHAADGSKVPVPDW